MSGSGKSSLAFDTIFAEGQRRYIDTFSSYARGYLGSMQRPDVDKISGLSPVISIDQKTTATVKKGSTAVRTNNNQAYPTSGSDFLLKYNIDDLEAAPWLHEGKRVY